MPPKKQQKQRNLSPVAKARKEELSIAREVYKDLEDSKQQILQKKKKLRSEYGSALTRNRNH